MARQRFLRNTSNSRIERHYFEQFRSHFPLPPGEVEYVDKPDVMLRGERTIGIELVRLFLVDGCDSSAEQIQAGLRLQLLEKAQEQYLAHGGRRIELTVSFNLHHPIRDVEGGAAALADAATHIANEPEGEVRREMFAHIPKLEFVYHNPREYSDARWRLAQAYTTPLLAVNRLAEIIESKHEKIRDYARCDALWLLVIVDFEDRAQDQDIQWPAETRPLQSQFDRIIVYKPQFAEWTDVPITGRQ